MSQIILSIGNGGFTHGSDSELDDFCLHFMPSNPNIGYVGWENNDDETRIERFYSKFSNVARSLSHLPMGASDTRIHDWLTDKDMFYFGGGNTAELVTALLACQTLSAFVTADKADCVLAGVSAGGGVTGSYLIPEGMDICHWTVYQSSRAGSVLTIVRNATENRRLKSPRRTTARPLPLMTARAWCGGGRRSGPELFLGAPGACGP